MLEKSVSLDDTFAEAWADLRDAYGAKGYFLEGGQEAMGGQSRRSSRRKRFSLIPISRRPMWLGLVCFGVRPMVFPTKKRSLRFVAPWQWIQFSGRPMVPGSDLFSRRAH